MRPYSQPTTQQHRPESGLPIVQSSHFWSEISPGLRWAENPTATMPGPAELRRRGYYLAKRLMDSAIALVLLVMLAPLLLLLAALIKLHSEGPAIFQQDRIGFDPRTGQPRVFKLYKFRSMRANCDAEPHREYVQNLIKNNTAPTGDGAAPKMVDDQRITGVGRILRKSSLDELPQFINVLKGDMSLVGPRPALPYEVTCYQEWHKRRLFVLPGLTGWWQVKGRSRVSFDEMVRMDLYYIDHQCLSLDLKILLLTPWAVISGRGAG